MTVLISATLTVSIAYFAFAFVATMCDRLMARFPVTAQVGYFPEPEVVELETPAIATVSRPVFRPAPVVASANLYQQCSIRQLKKLASQRKIKAYSSLTKPQLIAALA